MKKTGTIISILLILIGFSGFLGGALISNGTIDYNKELPLGDIKGGVVDSNKYIYIGLGFYGKVQVYDNNGEFVCNWKVNSSGGTFNIGITEEEKILISTARGNKQITYNKNGDIHTSKTIRDIYYDTKRSWNKFESKEGNKYEITRGMFPKIIMTYPYEKTIVNQRFFLQMMKGPLPAWLFAAFGLGLFVVLKIEKIQEIQRLLNKYTKHNKKQL